MILDSNNEPKRLLKTLKNELTIEQIIGRWKLYVNKIPFSFQREVHQRVIDSIVNRYGDVIVLIATRQMGKNEVSGVLEMDIMYSAFLQNIDMENLKCVPSGATQKQVSMERLEKSLIKFEITKNLFGKAEGNMIFLNKQQRGFEKIISEYGMPKMKYITAHPNADIAGSTVTHLLIGDEAQDIDIQKFERDIEPMGSFNNATMFFTGVAWKKDTLIYKKMQQAYEIEKRTGRKCVFKFDAYAAIKEHPEYAKTFNKIVTEKGLDNIFVQTQYLLNFIDNINGFFSSDQINLIYNEKINYYSSPKDGKRYVIGIDIAGEDESKTNDLNDIDYKRDSTILTVGELDFSVINKDNKMAKVNIVYTYEFNGLLNTEMQNKLISIIRYWGGSKKAKYVQKIVVDSTGIGEATYSFIRSIFGEDKVHGYKFKYKGDNNKSELGFLVYYYVNKELIQIPDNFGNDLIMKNPHLEMKHQIKSLIREAKEVGVINYYVPATSKRSDVVGHIGHDDYIFSLFLMIFGASICKKPFKRIFI